ncbi:hypothetical protein D0962_18070 [Leptolyngbyaceae cyanobacterium CCMR0082]|uniref:Uncharacterized protein n=1 Tax=Adonisia turfae CCMR0082 TaxID=2304604 RepID=A0A6M0S9I8_9CYAN|nr:hypothetical protein [Adonisia turfae]NEZ64671.1 hypothetical protein [Adonisia turfae CCMR0082]
MKLKQEDQEFRNPKVFYPDPKNVELDRVLVNLFVLLRCDGSRPTTKARAPANFDKVNFHQKKLAALPSNKGFDEHSSITQAWLESDVFDVVNRGKGEEAEVIASLKPLHIDASKIRIAKRCRDYFVSDHLYACLEYGERKTIHALKAFLDQGRDPGTGKYDGQTSLDLETLTVLKLVEGLPEIHSSGNKAAAYPPVCIGQARILCDDVQRLLVYKDVVPRAVMIEYLKAILGLHTGLYTLRLSRQLAGWINDKQAHEACLDCPVYGNTTEPFEKCPYDQKFAVDMGNDFRSKMARLAQESAEAEYGRLTELVRSVFVINQLLRYASVKRLSTQDSPAEAVSLLSDPPPSFEGFFEAFLDQIRMDNTRGDQELKPDEAAIFDLDLPAFEKFIELATHVRHAHHRRYLTQMLDKVFQKNTEYSALIQGKSTSNPRRWHLGTRLIEVFVQLAVLKWKEEEGRKLFYSEPILIDDFVQWVEKRYGFVLAGKLDSDESVSLADYTAYRENIQHLKKQLREIGFFDDLSDAFNAQTIRPRYTIDQSVES